MARRLSATETMTAFIAWLAALLSVAALVVLPVVVPPLRRTLITRPLLMRFRKVMPRMSQTEREALEAGTVGWDGELFSGRPAWSQLLAIAANEAHCRRAAVPRSGRRDAVRDGVGLGDDATSTTICRPPCGNTSRSAASSA